MPIHSLGVDLEVLVSHFGAYVGPTSQASNTADYYDYSNGLPHGVQACLEALKSKYPEAEYPLSKAIDAITEMQELGDEYALHERPQEWTVIVGLLEVLRDLVPKVEKPEGEVH